MSKPLESKDGWFLIEKGVFGDYSGPLLVKPFNVYIERVGPFYPKGLMASYRVHIPAQYTKGQFPAVPATDYDKPMYVYKDESVFVSMVPDDTATAVSALQYLKFQMEVVFSKNGLPLTKSVHTQMVTRSTNGSVYSKPHAASPSGSIGIWKARQRITFEFTEMGDLIKTGHKLHFVCGWVAPSRTDPTLLYKYPDDVLFSLDVEDGSWANLVNTVQDRLIDSGLMAKADNYYVGES